MELEQKIAIIRKKRLTSEDTVSTCHSALSAQRRVPIEIWEIIFSNACHPYSFLIDYVRDDSDDDDEYIVEAPALVLSHVCSRWRKIMKGTPSLWSSISVTFVDSFSKMSKAINTYLTNAADYPLNMRLLRRLGDYYYFLQESPDVAAWETLSRHFCRCRTLTLAVPNLSGFVEIGYLSFPHLKSIYEETDPGPQKQFRWFWGAVEHEAPLLTRVVLWDFDFSLPFSQITSLEVRRVPPGDIQLIHAELPACDKLEELSLWNLSDWSEDDGLSTERNLVRVGSLRKLCIYDEENPLMPYNKALSTFINATLLPSLTSFELRCHDWPPSLATLAERSPLLESVSLTIRSPASADFSLRPLFTFLHALPELKHVELCMGRFDSPSGLGDDMLAILLAHLETKSKIVFPKLESLSLRLSDLTLDTETVEKVSKVVSERRSVSPTLKEFCLLRDPTLDLAREMLGAPYERFVLEPALAGRLRDLERDLGIKVVIKNVIL
ncbi:hypothetical protein V5O48_018299 [Marasmius crinis-equi]|uniref:F-box domain-containing protein n=1 Tax=Marasmius crinis-equi TaxID=585013 RepID=A0ABR3ELS2_9AGAR